VQPWNPGLKVSLPSVFTGVVTYPEAPPSARAPSAISNSYGSSKATAIPLRRTNLPRPTGLDRAGAGRRAGFLPLVSDRRDRARVLPLPGRQTPRQWPKPANGRWCGVAAEGDILGRCSGRCSAGAEGGDPALLRSRSRTCWPASCWADDTGEILRANVLPTRSSASGNYIQQSLTSPRHADDARRPRRSRLRGPRSTSAASSPRTGRSPMAVRLARLDRALDCWPAATTRSARRRSCAAFASSFHFSRVFRKPLANRRGRSRRDPQRRDTAGWHGCS